MLIYTIKNIVYTEKMFPELRKNIIQILERAITILKSKSRDVNDLKELSNHTIHSASMFKDQDAILIATIIYSVYKVYSRDGNLDKIFHKQILESLEGLSSSLKETNYSLYNRNIKFITSLIKKIDKKYSMYVGEIFVKAKIVKGAMMFKHGLSLTYVAELLNISKWDLMSYVGKTKFTDVQETIKIVDRVKYLDSYMD